MPRGRARHEGTRCAVPGRTLTTDDDTPRTILFGLCGHGHFDLGAYDAFLAGELEDPEFSEQDMDEALAALPHAPALA